MHRQKQSAFTIIELLIVIVIIAILAAITIVAYNGITNKANQASAQSAAYQANKAVLAYMVQNADQVPTTLAQANVTNSGNTTYQYSYNNSVTPNTFCLTATTNNISYYVDNQTHNTPTAGACAGQAPNGESVVTNLLLNPSWESSSPLRATTANTGWALAAVSTSSTWSASGNSSLSILPDSADTSNDTGATIAGSVTSLSGNGVTLVPGQTYTVSAVVYLPKAQGSGTFTGRARSIYFADSVDGWQSSPPFLVAAPNTPGTYNLSLTFTVPTGATWAVVRLYHGGHYADGPIYWDNVMMTTGSTKYNFADGNSPGWAWTGTPNNSTSTGPAL